MVNDQSNKSDDPQVLPEKTDWTQTEALMKNPSESVTPASEEQAVQPMRTQLREPEGIIASFQAKKLKKRAALHAINHFYSAQLEVAKHTFEEAVRAKKADTELVTREFLDRLNERYIAHMTKLGISNVGVRNDAIVKLTDQLSATMREIQEKDWPEVLRKKALDGVTENFDRFFKKLMEELGEEKED